MKLQNPTSIQDIAALLGATFEGNKKLLISGINEIHKVEKGDLVFVDHPKYYKKALHSKADVILIDQKVEFPKGKGIIISKHPFDDFNKLTQHFSPTEKWTSPIGKDFKQGKNTIIHPHVVIGHHVTIGKNCIIHSGVIIGDNTTIENDVIVGPNSVIGHDAFYYKKKPKGYDRLLSCGGTLLKDRVEIGALTTIDRGVTGLTIIGEGTKIDNQVQVGHDTVIGKNCLFAANVGIAGCVVIEDEVTLWGQVGVTSDIVIGKGAVVQAQSGVGRSLKAGGIYFGSPAVEARKALKEMAALRKLPSIIQHL
ncbi:MAG: UDP-3-O-(3-hydroxymyristoyl)glucosamine N-acyltransferase [Crocinitomicaceae bacterium]